MFDGDVKKWNDPQIAQLNPGVKLPDQPITVVHRSDGSGTNAIFTTYLADVVPTWGQRVGAGKQVNWPVGLGAKGNEGVSGQLKTTPGAVGYVELAYALETGLPTAAVKNSAGQFLQPSLEGITADAAAQAGKMPPDMRAFIVNGDGQNVYPISGFTFLLVYQDETDQAKAQALVDYLWWSVHQGQGFSNALHYGKLPPEM